MRIFNVLSSGIFFGIAISWLFESIMVGKGPISTYLAPVAIAGILLSSIFSVSLSVRARRKSRP
jgi:apolipoprotein N-acyltransferase